MIGTAIALAAQFAPSIIGLISGPKAEAVATTVVNTAQAITGSDSPEAAKVALEKNPEMAVKFQQAANELEATIIREQGATLRSAIDADKGNPQTTRPKIAYGAFEVLSAVTIIVAGLWAYAIGTGNAEMVKQVVDGWPFVLAVTGPFAALLRAYFGILRHEQKEKMQAGAGQPIGAGIGGLISSLIGKR